MEKREYPRADLVFKLKFSTRSSSINTIGMSRDISGGGISFDAGSEIEPDTTLDLVFSIEGLSGEILAEGQVVRSWKEVDRIFTALEFKNIDPSDHEIILDFITRYLEEFHNE